MSFDKPERLLTKEEWGILSKAAADKACDYSVHSGRVLSQGNSMKLADFYARKANEIYDVLIKLGNEYYEAHPEEDPDKEGGEE